MDSTDVLPSNLQDSQRANPTQMAAPPDGPSSRSSSELDPISSSPPTGHAKRRLSNASASASISRRVPLILKGTGPELDPSSSHRPRPDVTYNLKALSHQTRSPPKKPNDPMQEYPGQIDLTRNLKPVPWAPTKLGSQEIAATANGPAQQASDQPQPAKRRRVDERDSPATDSAQGDSRETSHGHGPGEPNSFAQNANQELINYVRPILVDGGVTNPDELLASTYYTPFIGLQKKRDVDWNPGTRCDRWSFRSKIDVVALLVQITGSLSPRCCNKCNPEIGLFKGCIVTAPETMGLGYYGCANCLYHGRQTFCSLKSLNGQMTKVNVVHQPWHPPQQISWSKQLAAQQSTSWPLGHSSNSTSSTRGGPLAQPSCSACHRAHTACSHERPSCLRCRLGNVLCEYPEKVGTPTRAHQNTLLPVQHSANTTKDTSYRSPLPLSHHQRQVATIDAATHTKDSCAPNGTVDSAAHQRESIELTPPIQPKQNPSSSSSDAAGVYSDTSTRPSEILSMEPWERAPGRIRSQASANLENIAFSKSYLATGAEVQVCREATFRVEIIRSGHTHRLKAEENVTRICSIATAGKLSVKIDGEVPLVIGPHGMFTVRPRSACLVESEIYDDVALHITSVKTE